MKKYLVTIVICCICLQLAKAQNRSLDTVTNEFKYDTVYTSKFEKKEIYAKLKSWAGALFNSSKAAIQEDNYELGQLFINGAFQETYPFDGGTREARVSYKSRVYIKDNKVRVIITSIAIDSFTKLPELLKLRPDNFLNPALATSDTTFKKVLQSINKAINEKSESDF